MALLTDSNLVTMESLLPYESDLLETSDRERVELDTKIALAVSEVRTETEAEFYRLIRNGGETEFTAPAIGSVVATPSLLRWLCSRCLEHFYFECYGHQLNPRFKEKYEHYQERAAAEKEAFLQRGIGVVRAPLARPAATTVIPAAGAIPAGTVYLAHTWVNDAGQESAPGEIKAYAASGTEGIEAQHGTAPAGASGWNVYMGYSTDSLRRQNSTVLSLGGMWLQNAAPQTSSPGPGDGQLPDRFLQPRRIFLRG